MLTLGGVSFAATISVVCAESPPLSVTVSVTLNLVGTPAGAEKVCEGFARVLPAEPSPKFHEYVIGWPSGSLEPRLLNWTFSGATPKYLSAVVIGTGVLFPT